MHPGSVNVAEFRILQHKVACCRLHHTWLQIVLRYNDLHSFRSSFPQTCSHQSRSAHEPRASRLVASCKRSTSIASDGSWTYLTTDPRIKQLRADLRCGYCSSSTTLVSFSFMLRYWSTDTRTPETARLFFSSTMICASMVWGWVSDSLVEPGEKTFEGFLEKIRKRTIE